jgi:hypothetical protein
MRSMKESTQYMWLILSLVLGLGAFTWSMIQYGML